MPKWLYFQHDILFQFNGGKSTFRIMSKNIVMDHLLTRRVTEKSDTLLGKTIAIDFRVLFTGSYQRVVPPQPHRTAPYGKCDRKDDYILGYPHLGAALPQ